MRAPIERDDVLAMREDPGDRHLGHGDALAVGDLAQRVDEGQVALAVLLLAKRGAWARKSPAASSRSAAKCPLISPRLSTP